MTESADHQSQLADSARGEFVNTPEHDENVQPLNTDTEPTNQAAVNGSNVVQLRPGSASTADQISAPRADATHVIDGEIVDDEEGTEPVRVDRPGPTGASWWERQRAATAREVIPAWLRSRDELSDRAKWAARYAGHTAAFHTVRLPKYAGTFALRSPRGAGRVIAASWRWVYDAEGKPLRTNAVSRDDAAEYLKLAELREERVRKRLTLAFVGLLLMVAGVYLLAGYGSPLLIWSLTMAGVAALGWIGTPADKPVIGRAVVTQKAAKLTSEVVVRALASLGIAQINQAVGKGQGITFPAPITRDGPGWRAEVDLPYGVTVTDVMERRDKLASGLRRPMGCVWPEPVSEEHAGRLVIWVGDQDMSRAKQPAWPLAKHGEADIFKPLPFGTDQRGRLVSLLVMFSNVLIGAMPRQGKTFALRVLLLACALDPTVQLRIFELKGTGDLSGPGEKCAHHYGSGADDDTLQTTLDSLREIVKGELDRRAKVLRELPRELVRESKVTPQLAGRKSLGLRPIVIAIDECQELFSHPEFGKEAEELCVPIIKRGPALGIILILATQRPDSKSLPKTVSDNMGLRFALRVMGQEANDMILGTSSYKNGVRATMFGPKDKGIGMLVGNADDPQIVRSAYIDSVEADRISDRARALRENAGTLSGFAAGERPDIAAARIDTLDDMAAVFDPGEDRLWSDVIVTRLAELRPEVYGGWTAPALATALKPYGVEPKQVWATQDGKRANRRGYLLDAITEARTSRTTGSGA
jgi:S-DNA-T family DNA segregation ATPase FtsK/SpoIIIE